MADSWKIIAISSIFKFLLTFMSTEKVSQQLFMKVKQRLDYYRLPANFPFEATPLLNKLLNLLDSQGGSQSREAIISGQTDIVSGALKHEIARVTKQNNELHMNLIVAKEQIQSLEHNVFKYQSGKFGEGKQLQKCLSIKQKRQDELIEQLREIKYKYNQLMDFLHEDPRADRQYIKRLMKHKQVQINDVQPEEAPAGAKGQNDSAFNIRELQFKVKNREDEIKRLQKLIEYDGTNMNKLIKNFNDDLVKKQLKNADSKINYLQESYDKIKKQNQSMRNKNGLKEALRAEVEKCHQVIDTLKKENQKLKRNHQEQHFDHQKKASENQRNMGKTKAEKTNAEKINQQNQATICDLQKQVEFLNNQLAESSEIAKNAEEFITDKEEEISNFQKKIEEQKVFYEYEFDVLRKKVTELETENDQHLLKVKELMRQLDLTVRQNQLKNESIINLEKIVNELIRKNSILTDHTPGTHEQSLKQSASLEYKSKLGDLQRHVRQLQDERAQLEANLRSTEHRLAQLAKQNQRFKHDNGILQADLISKDNYVMKSASQFDELKYALKKEQAEHSRTSTQTEQALRLKQSLISELKSQNERLAHQEKALKLRIKDLQIKISEEEGVWQVTRERLDEKESKIKQLEKLLIESVEQTKVLTNTVNELDHQNHELTREKHRLIKKYEELKKDDNEFKNTSFKNYQTAINENLNEMTELRRELLKLAQSNQTLSVRYEEANNMLQILEREKQLAEFDKISFARQVDILKARLIQMQQMERTLVLQNQSLRTLAKSL